MSATHDTNTWENKGPELTDLDLETMRQNMADRLRYEQEREEMIDAAWATIARNRRGISAEEIDDLERACFAPTEE